MGYTLWFGKPYRQLDPGMHFIAWPLESLHRYYWTRTDEVKGRGVLQAYRGSFVSTSERIYDPPQYEITTRDRLVVNLNMVMFYRIVNLKQAFFNVMDLYASMEQVLCTAIIEKAAGMSLEEAVEGKVAFQEHVFSVFSEKCKLWGVEITRVEIQSITPPKSIVDATVETVEHQRRNEAELRRRKAAFSGEMQAVERAHEIQAKENEKTLAQTNFEAEMKRLKADADFYASKRKAEGEYEHWSAQARAKREEIDVLKGSGMDGEVLTEYLKWSALQKMNVQFIPTEALGLLKATRLYRELEGPSK
jgi:regulator of protease activity HflC (stomatin/prohibitin superfamily)